MLLVPTDHRGRIHQSFTPYGKSVKSSQLEVCLPKQETDILVFAGIHGEEPESTVLLSRALRLLPSQPERCAVVLAANPDGLAMGTRGNANGVDLNRNFPAQNWTEDSVYHRWEIGSSQNVALSSGQQAASEPETLALIQLIDQLKPRMIVAVHTPLACIDDPNNTQLGQWMAKETGLPLVPDVGTPTPGSFGSWCADCSLPVITYELPATSVWSMLDTHLTVLHKLLVGDYPAFEEEDHQSTQLSNKHHVPA